MAAERTPPMDPDTVKATLKMHLKEARGRLDQAAGIARAAEACADAGNVDKAIEITHDIEQLIYEVTTLLNAASLINRIADH